MLPEIRRLAVRMATDNPGWGYTRIQGASKNLGHRVARPTSATILQQQGIPPSGERPTSWHTFLRAHWGALLAAHLFTTEVWTFRGLVTCYTVFVIELHSRRVHISQLLTKREVFKGDRPVSPTDQADQSEEDDERGQHG